MPEPRPAERVKSGPNTAPDFDELRREFESDIGDTAEYPPLDGPTDFDPTSLDALVAKISEAAEAERQMFEMDQHAAEIRADLSRQVEAADIRDLLREVQAELPDASENMLIRELYAAYHLDGEIKAAWDNRNRGRIGEFEFRRVIEGKLIPQLKAELAPRYDADATETKAAIASFMRGGRDRPASPAFPRDISNMSDTDFKRTLDRMGIDSERTRI